MRVSLKSGERLFVNGAVLRFSQRTSVEFMNDAQFLMEQNVMQREEAVSPLSRVYFAVQAMLIDPAARAENALSYSRMLRAARAAGLHDDLLEQVDDLVGQSRFHEAMKRLRVEMKAEPLVTDIRPEDERLAS